MTDRDWAGMPYVRVYQSIKSDPKFATVYEDDRALAAWVRLLLDADAAYPARLGVPAYLSRHARDVLTKAGILTVTSGTYSVSGLAKERSSRAMTAAERAKAYRDRLHRNGSVTGESQIVTPHTPAGPPAPASVSVSGSVVTPEGGAGGNQPNPLMEAIAYIEERTRRPWVFGPGSKVWDALEPDVRDFGWPAVKAAMESEKAPFPDAGQLVFGASRRLHPISGPEKQAELDPEYVKRAVAAQRKAKNGA